MAITIFDNLKKLYGLELYKSVIELGEILLKSYTRNKSLLTNLEYYETLCYLAHTYLLEEEYRQAESLFREALAAKRLLSSSELVPAAFADECEFKYKIAKCLTKMNQQQEAIDTIESIPAKQRTPKVHYLYGQLSKKKTTNVAIAAFKEVLKEHQLALDVAEELLELGTSGLEVNSLMVDATHWPQCQEWLPNWIEAQSFLAAHNYTAAIQKFQLIENNSSIQNHQRILIQIAKCYLFLGSNEPGLRYMARAQAESPHLGSEGLIVYANLLCRENRISDLEKLSASSVTVNEYKHEHWYILALLLFFTDRYERVNYFLDRAMGKNTFLDIEATMLKTKVYITAQKYAYALAELRTIMKVAENRFELYRYFVEIYVNLLRYRDAQAYAAMAVKKFPKTPRVLMLYAKSYEDDPSMQTQYKAVLWRIHKLDENYLPAIYMLVEMLKEDKEYDKAVRILRQQLVVQPNTRLATTMGDIFVILKEYSGALGFYNMAIRMDSTNQKALNALNNMSVEGKRTAAAAAGGSGDAPMGNCSTDKLPELKDLPWPNESLSIAENETLWSDVDVEGEMNN